MDTHLMDHNPMPKMAEPHTLLQFKEELRKLLNTLGMDAMVNIPDHILADHLTDHLINLHDLAFRMYCYKHPGRGTDLIESMGRNGETVRSKVYDRVPRSKRNQPVTIEFSKGHFWYCTEKDKIVFLRSNDALQIMNPMLRMDHDDMLKIRESVLDGSRMTVYFAGEVYVTMVSTIDGDPRVAMVTW